MMQVPHWRVVMVLLAVALLSACASTSQVKPWEKGTLAKQAMTPGGVGRDNSLYSHVYTSKETARGGDGVGGGGCGCN